MTFDDVAAFALARYPDVERATAYGRPALRVAGRLLTCEGRDRADLVLFDVPVEERAMLIEASPEVFHTTDHYLDHPAVLARLATLGEARLAGFLDRRFRSIAGKRRLAVFAAREA